MIYASLVSQLHRLAPGTSGETSTVTRNGGTLTAADVAAFLDKGTSVIVIRTCAVSHISYPLQFDFNKSGAATPFRDGITYP